MCFRFNKNNTKELIDSVLSEELTGKIYNPEDAQQLCAQIATRVKTELKGTY